MLQPWLYLGGLIALIFLAPSLYWQAENGWPFLELSKAGADSKNLVLSPPAFIGQQLLFVGPARCPRIERTRHEIWSGVSATR